MSEIIIIIQEHGHAEPRGELTLAAEALVGDLHDALRAAGVAVDDETIVFVDEIEEPLPKERHHRAHHLRHGSRVHVGRVREVHVGVNFMARTIERRFSPGARVAGVKKWAVKELGVPATDAAEHVLQIHGTADKPSPDTPIHQLAHRHGHRLDFDFVPEKRVEG